MRKHRLVSTIVVLILTVNLMLILNSQNALAASKISLNSSYTKYAIGTLRKDNNGNVIKVGDYAAYNLDIKYVYGNTTIYLNENEDYKTTNIAVNKVSVYKSIRGKKSFDHYDYYLQYTLKAIGTRTYSGTYYYNMSNPKKYDSVATKTVAKPINLSNAKIQISAKFSSTGQIQTRDYTSGRIAIYSNPSIVLYDSNGKKLAEGTDYKITTSTGSLVSGFRSKTATIQGIGNYTGIRYVDYKIKV